MGKTGCNRSNFTGEIMRKLTKAELKKYGSQEAFDQKQKEYLDKLEAQGKSPRTLQSRLSKLKSNSKPMTTAQHMDAGLGGYAVDVRAITRDWYRNPYFKYDCMHSRHDMTMMIAALWLEAQKSYKPGKGASERSYCSKVVNRKLVDKLRRIKHRQPFPNSTLQSVDVNHTERMYRNDDQILRYKSLDIMELLEEKLGGFEAGIICDNFGIGLSKITHAEIAKLYDITPRQVNTIVTRFKANKELNDLIRDLIT